MVTIFRGHEYDDDEIFQMLTLHNVVDDYDDDDYDDHDKSF